VLEHVKSGKLTTGHLTGTTRPLSQANEALEDLKAGRTMRTILIPGATPTPITAIDPKRSTHDLAY
jgi:hypothetical protein